MHWKASTAKDQVRHRTGCENCDDEDLRARSGDALPQRMRLSGKSVSYLVPLKAGLEEDDSAPRIHLSEGPNTIGRSSVPIADERLSRKHLTIIALATGLATLSVRHGTNLVVIRSRGERKKLYSSDEVSIANGDGIELIPGHHYFKLVVLSVENGDKEKRINF